MKSDIEYKGEWFLPSHPNIRVPGTLYFDNVQGSRLELIGSFSDNNFVPAMDTFDIILGITSNSKYLTLYDSFTSKSMGPTLRVGKEVGKTLTTIRVNFIIEGIHVNSSKDLKFEKLSSEIDNLDEWIDISGFEERVSDVEKSRKNEIEVKYKLPDPIKFNLSDKVKGEFNFLVNRPSFGTFEKQLTISQKVEIVIESSEQFTIEEGLRILTSFQNFLILGLYQHTNLAYIKLHSENFKDESPDDFKRPVDVKLFFPIKDNNKNKKSKSFYDMLFAYGHIKNSFQTIIRNWFNKYEILEPAFDLVFDHFYNSGRFSTNTFLNLAQAAETFHARVYNHTRIPKSEYKKMKETILNLTPKEYHSWLNDQFNFGNNLNLHNRLFDLCQKYSNSILDKIIGDKNLFVKQIKDSRNYYTHYSENSKAKALKGQELYVLTEKLKVLLVSAFLIEVGFEKTLLEDLLESNRYRFFNHLI